MMVINSLEFFVLAGWGMGVASGLWFYLSSRSLQSVLVLGASVVVPVLGSTAAVVLALGRYIVFCEGARLGKQATSLTAK